MNITVDEMVDMTNRTKDAMDKAYKQGRQDRENEFAIERANEPKHLFKSLINYADSEGLLIDHHYSSNAKDGCNWAQIKPTRDGAKGTKYVEIAFGDDLNSIDHIGIGTED